MAELITTAQSDSTNDGSGASTIMEPPQLDNATDDCIIIKVTQSLNNSSNVAAINVTTPSGYTLLTDLRDSELRSWVFYKQSTGSETIPAVTSDTSARWTCTTVVVTDVDWASGGLTQHVQNTAGGDTQSTDLTTDSGGTASAIVCLYSLERRSLLGFRYPQTRPQTVYKGEVATGASEGVDNTSGAGFDFMTDRSANFDAPFWEANGGGDSLAINIEVLVEGNIIPLQVTTYLAQAAPVNTFQTSANWIREIIQSGKNLDGTTMDTWTFDASSDVDTATDQITITGHGMDESMVVHLSDGGNTAPTGLSDASFYYVYPIDANTIQLMTAKGDSDAAGDFYYNGTTQLPAVNISATGSGTMTLTEARMINAGQNALDIFRLNNGDSGNPGSAPGSYVGDGGYNQNWMGTAQIFASPFDATNETINFQFRVNGQGRIGRGILLLIDADGDWMSWNLYVGGISNRDIGQTIFQVQADKTSIQNKAYQSFGTFDATRIRYFVLAVRGNNTSVTRFGAANSAQSTVNLGGPITVVGGQEASFSDLVALAETYTDALTKPSDLQFTSTIPVAIGDGTTDVSFTDSEKSLAFPPLANGTTTFETYLETIGVTLNATSGSSINVTNTQIGASLPYDFEAIIVSGATVDLTGNAYVFANAVLDSDINYNRQLFVGGQGVKDNDSEVRNSTFIVNSQLGANNGIIDWEGTTDIESSTFELSSGTTTGHGIKFAATGTYTLNDLTFNSFGADGTNTAAIFNDSGGAVTVNITNGAAPTVRNGAGASTTVNVIAPITVTVTDTGGTPIQNARVYIRPSGGGSAILTGLTDASGVLTGDYTGATPQAIEGWVRKSTLPGTLYKQFAIAGTITSSGFNVTALMAEDA